MRQGTTAFGTIALLCAFAHPALGQAADVVAVNGKVFTARDGGGLVELSLIHI